MSVAGLRGRIFSALTLVALAIGCGGGTDGGTNPGTNPGGTTPTISIALAAGTASVTQGAASTVNVTLTRGGGFTGDVTISVSGMPTGVTVANATIASGQTSATLSINAAATAAAGTATLTIQASGTGVSATSATLTLTVSAQQQQTASFTMTAAPTSVTLVQGATGAITLNLARTNFTGAVNLAVTGAPTGLTAAFAANGVTGNTATLNLTAAANLAAGTSTLTITASGTGVSNQQATVSVIITATQVVANTTFKFCGTSGVPIWVATQDGTGAWARVTGTSDTYAFNISQSKGGIAYVVPVGTGFELDVFYGTAAELVQRGTELCNGALGAGKSVTATVTGAGATDLLVGSLATVAGTFTAGTSVAWAGVPAGNVDLITSRSTLAFNGGAITPTLQKVIIRRGLNPTAGGALAAIDFGGSEGFTALTKNLTINNLNGEITTGVTSYFTTNNQGTGAYQIDIGAAAGATRTYAGIPTAQQLTGDLHVLIVSAIPSLTNTAQTRNVIAVFKDAVDKTVTLGSALTTPTVTALAATGYGRARAVITTQAEYGKYFVFDTQQPNSPSRRTYIQQTVGYAGGATITMDIPDLSTVSGFDTNWGLKTGTVATYTITATGWTANGGVSSPPLSDGAVFSSGTKQGSVTP